MNLPLIITTPLFEEHLTGLGHPESPGRWGAVMKGLTEAGLLGKENLLEPRAAILEELMLSHPKSYIELVERECAELPEGQVGMLSTGDAVICKKSYEIAKMAVGAGLEAVDAVMKGRVKSAFALVRPPGHHAESNKGMGFCLFNNIAIAARYAQKKYGVKRPLIVDWDVHHGNGTQEIFYEDPSVFYFSTHQWPLYPGTGSAEETGGGTTMNVQITATPDAREKVLLAFESTLVEKMKEFKPDLILISAGFDAHVNDPLGGLNLTDADFGRLTEGIKKLAHTYAAGRVVSMLEGGYNLNALSSAAAAHVKRL